MGDDCVVVCVVDYVVWFGYCVVVFGGVCLCDWGYGGGGEKGMVVCGWLVGDCVVVVVCDGGWSWFGVIMWGI